MQQLHRTGDLAGGTRQVSTGAGGDECSHAQDRTGRLPTCDHDHNERNYACSDERFDQLYVVVHNTAGYVNSMCTTGARAAEAARDAIETADCLQEHGDSINNLPRESQQEVQCPMQGKGPERD
jgi:hypothetical protein